MVGYQLTVTEGAQIILDSMEYNAQQKFGIGMRLSSCLQHR